jgi:hypothetical protein
MTSRELSRRQVDLFQRWCWLNKLKVVDVETGQSPELLAYLLEGLMEELDEMCSSHSSTDVSC